MSVVRTSARRSGLAPRNTSSRNLKIERSTSFRCFDFLDEFPGIGIAQNSRISAPASRGPIKERLLNRSFGRVESVNVTEARKNAANCAVVPTIGALIRKWRPVFLA